MERAKFDFSFIDYKTAVANGVKCHSEPPESKKCPFCGKMINYIGVCRKGEIKSWFFPLCDCEEAKADHERRQEEEMRQIFKKGQEEARKAKIDKMIASSGVKRRFLERTFENYKTSTLPHKQAYGTTRSYARKWEENKKSGRGLYLQGANGTGKTHLAAAIANELMPKGVPVIFKTVDDLFDSIKQTFDGGEVYESEIIQTYCDIDLLILDDLGKEQCTDWAVSKLFSVINGRYEDYKPTIITSNYSMDELLRVLTPKGQSDNEKAKAIISRLREMSEIVTMSWGDYRDGGNI